jgi:hypothetical protein
MNQEVNKKISYFETLITLIKNIIANITLLFDQVYRK